MLNLNLNCFLIRGGDRCRVQAFNLQCCNTSLSLFFLPLFVCLTLCGLFSSWNHSFWLLMSFTQEHREKSQRSDQYIWSVVAVSFIWPESAHTTQWDGQHITVSLKVTNSRLLECKDVWSWTELKTSAIKLKVHPSIHLHFWRQLSISIPIYLNARCLVSTYSPRCMQSVFYPLCFGFYLKCFY